ncbi:hypothetical protein KOR34_36640 [Posidoniimonas corsicana]|uniref:DUF7919 domain-containing protein n=1 Tax=Posidoniimonas corsicana TaxID=1938618 RepID=A0A5C5V6X5_9BACT|nr:hypothetical protein KOR34_36640 [Posidoniimonas corsicana]
MAAVVDLEPCSCLPVGGVHILAVGWLGASSPIPTGPTPKDVYQRLKEFLVNPWQPFVSMGVHECELCQFEGEAVGNANLFIPYDQRIYVCPAMISHYINAHRYQPPSVFMEAVRACPPMHSMEYKKLLVQCNGRILWQDGTS